MIYHFADTLKRAINGSSQNANESFHSVLWSLAPKSRYATGVVIDLCAVIAVLSYNDGNQSLIPVITEITGKNVYKFGIRCTIISILGGSGFYTTVAMRRLDERRVYYEHKLKKKIQEKPKLTKGTPDSPQNNRMSLGNNGDESLDDSYISGAY